MLLSQCLLCSHIWPVIVLPDVSHPCQGDVATVTHALKHGADLDATDAVPTKVKEYVTFTVFVHIYHALVLVYVNLI